VGVALKINTSHSATILTMSNPHLMEINCKDEGQIELATVVSNGTRGTELGTLTCTESVNYDTYQLTLCTHYAHSTI
jgi:hypothetical protein